MLSQTEDGPAKVLSHDEVARRRPRSTQMLSHVAPEAAALAAVSALPSASSSSTSSPPTPTSGMARCTVFCMVQSTKFYRRFTARGRSCRRFASRRVVEQPSTDLTPEQKSKTLASFADDIGGNERIVPNCRNGPEQSFALLATNFAWRVCGDALAVSKALAPCAHVVPATTELRNDYKMW